ncbi:MAG: S9 family peptidase [Planctomycetota bacterium]|jgi:dipeptidyl aminopeptidase/acylaminoacyl peptidase
MRHFLALHSLQLPLLIAALALPLAAQTEKQSMTVVDLINLPSLGDPQLSPNGKQLLFTRSEADWKQNKTIGHVWRINSDGSGMVQMTNGAKGERNPRWSPDGKEIVFIAQRDADKRGQIYRMRNDGGEALRLTDHPTAVSGIQWSPDGEQIYFTASDDKTDAEKAREKVNDNVFAFDETQKNTHIWRVEVASGESQPVTTGEFTVRGFELSRDGTMIAHHRAPSPLLDDGARSEVWIMRADGSEPRQLTENTIGEGRAAFSPDNSKVLFVANTNDKLEEFYYNPRLFVVPASGGTPDPIIAGGQFSVGGASWSADGESIYFTANTGVRQNIYRVDVSSREVSSVTSGDQSMRGFHFSHSANMLAFNASHPRNPGEIQVLSANGGEARQVTRVYDEVLARHELPRVEAIQWAGEDGASVEGLLFYPLAYQEGTRYPLVVQTHGGPASSDKFGFFRSSNYIPVLANLGYFVFKPNYRGSTGYGDEFLRNMVGNYFDQAHKDVMSGVDALIEGGLVDGDRMAKMGWSAGGHMTNKIITYTDRFKAASSGAGAINWISMYGQSDTRVYRTPWFGGTPWQEDAPITQYLSDSPLFQTHKVTTPTIILVGENDARVPMPQSVELYRALKSNGVPTHLYVAPKQGHGWRELPQRLFKANVELDWFERWVRNRKYDWEKSPIHPEESEAMEASSKK